MSWLKDLYDTYQSNLDQVGVGNENPLLPVLHKLENTQVVVTLDLTGNFISAQASDLRDTIIPCSEKSLAKTSGIAAHPLSEVISYISHDFGDYAGYEDCSQDGNCSSKKCARCRQIVNHELYKDQLYKWANWSKHPHLQSIYKYVSTQCLLKDLVHHKILYLSNEGQLAQSWNGNSDTTPAIFKILKKPKKKQTDISIRWSIADHGLRDTWINRELHELWIDYYSQTSGMKGFCMISGNNDAIISTRYPMDTRQSGDRAKIISANDHDNFTYKGRFEKERPHQVATLGLEENHAAHAALKWLIKKQGYYNYDTFAIVAWGIGSTDIIQPLSVENDLFGDNETEYLPDTNEGVGRVLAQSIRGYAAKSNISDEIVILAIDAPVKNKGRSSVIHYSRHSRSDYLDKIEKWHTKAAWHHFSPKLKTSFFGAPSPKRIAEACFGRAADQKNWEIDSKILSRTIKRLLPCIIEERPIPPDLTNIAIQRANKKAAFKTSEYYKWEQVLSVACSLYKHTYEPTTTMALNPERNTRDYLFGRLLAIADCLEGFALSQQGEERQTNAARLMARFSQRPLNTWLILKDKLVPYEKRLGPKKAKYEKAIVEVMDLFDPDDFNNPARLSGEYLLGYYCQKSILSKSKNNNSQDKKNDEHNQ